MYWIVLLIASIFETAWAIGLKYTDGFTKLVPSVLTILCMVISMALLSYAVKGLPIGIAYATWTGIGAVGSVILGIYLFNESRDVLKLFFVGLIIVGIIGLKFSSK
ncbi:MAG TPA: quaternary ammonium compound efflux SMR transporter SugE [Cytophagaceae bacterium]